jgi:hypothetical protein
VTSYDMGQGPVEQLRQARAVADQVTSTLVSTGDPRKVEVSCLTTGEVREIRVAATYSSNACADELGTSLRDTLRTGQEAAAERRADASAKIISSLDDLTANLTRSMSVLTNRLNEIVSNLDRLTFGRR